MTENQKCVVIGILIEMIFAGLIVAGGLMLAVLG